MLIQNIPLMCCFESPHVWCFKTLYTNNISNIRQPTNMRHGLPYVIKFVDKE